MRLAAFAEDAVQIMVTLALGATMPHLRVHDAGGGYEQGQQEQETCE